MIIPKNETLSDAFFGLSNLFHWPTPLLTEVMVCPMLFNIFCTSSTDGLTYERQIGEHGDSVFRDVITNVKSCCWRKQRRIFTSILGKLRKVSRTKMISPAVYCSIDLHSALRMLSSPEAACGVLINKEMTQLQFVQHMP